MNKIIMMIAPVLIIVLLAPSFSSKADLSKLIKNVMPNGTMSNITKNSIVNEQSAGHLIGGSVIIKTPAEPGLQLIQAKAPSCKLGGLPCGAQFELIGGAMSMINSEELIRYVKAMAQNTGGYGAMMLVKTICPQCEDLMTWLDSKSDMLNSMLKTDCEDMAKLADGALSKISATAQATRQSAAVLSGDGKDMGDIAKKSKKDKLDPTGGNPELENIIGDNFNLVWKALAKKAPTSGDNNVLKELLMSVSGTIIGRKDEEARRSIIHKKSLINKEMIAEFIGGQKASGKAEMDLYVCDEKKNCLNPEIKSGKFEIKDSFMGRIQELLSSIVVKIQKDKEPFTEEEETLIALSSMSLVTKIELDLASYSSAENTIVAQTEFIEALSFDVVTSYLGKLLQEVQTAVGELEYVQLGGSEIFMKFDAEAREIMTALSRAKHDAFKRYDLITATKARLRQELSRFDSEFEEFLSHQNEL